MKLTRSLSVDLRGQVSRRLWTGFRCGTRQRAFVSDLDGWGTVSPLSRVRRDRSAQAKPASVLESNGARGFHPKPHRRGAGSHAYQRLGSALLRSIVVHRRAPNPGTCKTWTQTSRSSRVWIFLSRHIRRDSAGPIPIRVLKSASGDTSRAAYRVAAIGLWPSFPRSQPRCHGLTCPSMHRSFELE